MAEYLPGSNARAMPNEKTAALAESIDLIFLHVFALSRPIPVEADTCAGSLLGRSNLSTRDTHIQDPYVWVMRALFLCIEAQKIQLAGGIGYGK
jgi:hypothetical protein